MNMIELIAPCHFGLESVLKREVLDLGYEIASVEDGRVTFLRRYGSACASEYFSENGRESAFKSRLV